MPPIPRDVLRDSMPLLQDFMSISLMGLGNALKEFGFAWRIVIKKARSLTNDPEDFAIQPRIQPLLHRWCSRLHKFPAENPSPCTHQRLMSLVRAARQGIQHPTSLHCRSRVDPVVSTRTGLLYYCG